MNLLTSISVNGQRVIVPVDAGIGSSHIDGQNWWISEVLKVLPESTGKIFVDVGVNVGQTLIQVKTVLSDMEYIGFEPNPACVNYLERLIYVNRWSKVSIVPVGISSKCQLTKLYLYSDDVVDTCASIVDNFRSVNNIASYKYCACYSGRDIEKISDISNMYILKIDVEGAECDVIFGLIDSIRKHRPYIIIEILPVYSSENKERLDRQNIIESEFNELGYSFYRIVKDCKSKSVEFCKISNIEIHSNLDWCDYLFAPKVLE